LFPNQIRAKAGDRVPHSGGIEVTTRADGVSPRSGIPAVKQVDTVLVCKDEVVSRKDIRSPEDNVGYHKLRRDHIVKG
jgi:hypothetical protein